MKKNILTLNENSSDRKFPDECPSVNIPIVSKEQNRVKSDAIEKVQKRISYEELFLNKAPIENKKQCTVILDRVLVEKLSRFLAIAGNGTSFSSFLNSILYYHTEINKNKINELYDKFRKELF
ncbi:MAG: DUF3408 domain-containing protein [Tannerellaceae bacterium]|nr:DUF3408 domain-containing protein [Tannerellaceae bacterium]